MEKLPEKKEVFAKNGVLSPARRNVVFCIYFLPLRVFGHADFISAVKILDLLGTAGVAELTDRLVLNLADPLSGHAEDLPYLL